MMEAAMVSGDASKAAWNRDIPAPNAESMLQPVPETWSPPSPAVVRSDLPAMPQAANVQAQPAAPLGAPPPQPPASMQQAVNVTTHVTGPTVVLAPQRTGPNFIVRALWFIFLGSWLSAILIV